MNLDEILGDVFNEDAGTTALGRKKSNGIEEQSNQTPNARGSVNKSQVTPGESVTFDASASSDPDGEIRTYYWSFADGTVLSGQKVTRKFDESDVGMVKGTITVTDYDGATDDTSVPVKVEPPNQPPTARASVSKSQVTPGELVTFDASASSDPDGSIRTYSWSFSDGTNRRGQTVTRQFGESDVGTVKGTLTVSDNDGASDSTSVQVKVEEPPNQAPTARASVSPQSGRVPFTATFDGSDSSDPDGSIGSYIWRFPDGDEIANKTVERSYTADDVGTIEATVEVVDGEGESDTDTASVTVKRQPNELPVAQASASPASGSPPLTVTLSGKASTDPDGSITGYSWAIPGKGTKTGEEVTVEFTEDDIGSTEITLTVTDNRNATATDSVTVDITEQQTLPEISDELVAQGAIVGASALSSALFNGE